MHVRHRQQALGFCHTLRHDGIDYGDYIEQLTYLLFLKMAHEKGVDVPAGYDWETLRAKSGQGSPRHTRDAGWGHASIR